MRRANQAIAVPNLYHKILEKWREIASAPLDASGRAFLIGFGKR
jgi:hypothetical protein